MSSTQFVIARHRAAQKRRRHLMNAGIPAADVRNEEAVRAFRDGLDETKSEIADLRCRIGRAPKGGRASDADTIAFRAVSRRLSRKLGAMEARHLDERFALGLVLAALGFPVGACAAVAAHITQGEPCQLGPDVLIEGDFGAEVSLARVLGALNFSDYVRAKALAVLATEEAA